MSRYQTWAGTAKEPFSESATRPGKTIDALGQTVFDTAGGVMRPLLWTDYQAELAASTAKAASYSYVGGAGGAGQATALSASGGGGGGYAGYGGGSGYAGRGFVNVVFDDDGLKPLKTEPAPTRHDVCTCGGQKYGGGTCSSWCDSSAARAQHAGGAS